MASGITQDRVDRVAAKVQQLYESLPDDEKPVLDRLLDLAAAFPEVQGHAAVPQSRTVQTTSPAEEQMIPPNTPWKPLATDEGLMFRRPAGGSFLIG